MKIFVIFSFLILATVSRAAAQGVVIDEGDGVSEGGTGGLTLDFRLTGTGILNGGDDSGYGELVLNNLNAVTPISQTIVAAGDISGTITIDQPGSLDLSPGTGTLTFSPTVGSATFGDQTLFVYPLDPLAPPTDYFVMPGYTLTPTSTPNQFAVSFDAVPEPSTWLLMAASALGLFGWARQRLTRFAS